MIMYPLLTNCALTIDANVVGFQLISAPPIHISQFTEPDVAYKFRETSNPDSVESHSSSLYRVTSKKNTHKCTHTDYKIHLCSFPLDDA